MALRDEQPVPFKVANRPAQPGERDRPAARAVADDATGDLSVPSFENWNRVVRATAARLTQGLSPNAQMAAWFDWASHLARSPGRQVELGIAAAQIAAL
jgi:polyhydroxyalkanoate synthase